MRTVLLFLKGNISALIAAAIGEASVFAVCRLSGVDDATTLYAVALSMGLCLIVAFVRFCGFVRKLRRLDGMLNAKGADLSGFPDASNAVEEGYQRLAERLSRELTTSESRYAAEIRDLSDYYTLWAHQIKTPISAMRLMLKPEQTKLGEELFKIEQYVDMALSIARMQSGVSDYVIRRQPLDPIVRKSIRKYARLFIGKKLSLRYDGCSAQVNTDAKWLGFIIEQLISNAIKYTAKGGIEIIASDRFVTVSDSGIGIAPECLPRVFDKGFTGYVGRADEKSTGLGLYMAKTAAVRLGHSLTISSVPGQGTTVKIGFSSQQGIFE